MASKEICMAELRWWQTSWKRIGTGLRRMLIGLVLLCVLLLQVAVMIWELQPVIAHVMLWHTAREIALENPNVALMPQPLADTRVGTLKDGMSISCFGYVIQVPWATTKVMKDFKTVAIFGFADGSSLQIFDPADHMDMLKATPADEAAQREGLRPLLGDDAVRSHYDYANAELYARPNEIAFFHSRHRNARAMMLLTMKSMDIPEGTTVIYSVTDAHIRGFQFGDPKKVPMLIQLLLFDDHDRAMKLTLKGPRGSTQPVLTQEQINAIIASVRPPD